MSGEDGVSGVVGSSVSSFILDIFGRAKLSSSDGGEDMVMK